MWRAEREGKENKTNSRKANRIESNQVSVTGIRMQRAHARTKKESHFDGYRLIPLKISSLTHLSLFVVDSSNGAKKEMSGSIIRRVDLGG